MSEVKATKVEVTVTEAVMKQILDDIDGASKLKIRKEAETSVLNECMLTLASKPLVALYLQELLGHFHCPVMKINDHNVTEDPFWDWRTFRQSDECHMKMRLIFNLKS